jgi:hypothetical protein
MDTFIRSVAMVSRACGFVAAMLILISEPENHLVRRPGWAAVAR